MKHISTATRGAIEAVMQAHWNDPTKSLSELYRIQSIVEDLADVVAPDTGDNKFARREFINNCIGEN